MRVPEDSRMDYFKIRIAWGVRVMDRFLLGTLLNLFGGAIGLIVHYVTTSFCKT